MCVSTGGFSNTEETGQTCGGLATCQDGLRLRVSIITINSDHVPDTLGMQNPDGLPL